MTVNTEAYWKGVEIGKTLDSLKEKIEKLEQELAELNQTAVPQWRKLVDDKRPGLNTTYPMQVVLGALGNIEASNAVEANLARIIALCEHQIGDRIDITYYGSWSNPSVFKLMCCLAVTAYGQAVNMSPNYTQWSKLGHYAAVWLNKILEEK